MFKRHFNISQADRNRVSKAIGQAELGTSGEIVVVAANASDDYIHVPLHIAAGFALAVPLFLPLISQVSAWGAISLQWVFLLQLIVFIVTALVLSLPRLRAFVTPKSLMRKYAHQHAAAQFLASNISVTRERTGILIFVSLLERYVEIVGDRAIAAKLNPSDWQKIIDLMIPDLKNDKIADALIRAIGLSGDLLNKHFPANDENSNELPDHFIVLD